jgi:hypothetical protein
MRALALNIPRVATGAHSLTGLSSGCITFNRADHNEWAWNGTPLFRISAERKLRQITLRDGELRFPVFEHVGALMATGLRGISLEITPTAPYFSHAGELWGVLKKHAVATDVEITPVTPQRELRHSCGNGRFIQFSPSETGTLEIEVRVAYPDILEGREHVERYVFPNQELLERVLAAPTLGRLPWYVEPIVSRLTSLPSVNKVLWKRHYQGPENQRELLRMICDHRVLDILGALSLVTRGAHYLSGRILSVKGGHACDIKLVTELREPGIFINVR